MWLGRGRGFAQEVEGEDEVEKQKKFEVLMETLARVQSRLEAPLRSLLSGESGGMGESWAASLFHLGIKKNQAVLEKRVVPALLQSPDAIEKIATAVAEADRERRRKRREDFEDREVLLKDDRDDSTVVEVGTKDVEVERDTRRTNLSDATLTAVSSSSKQEHPLEKRLRRLMFEFEARLDRRRSDFFLQRDSDFSMRGVSGFHIRDVPQFAMDLTGARGRPGLEDLENLDHLPRPPDRPRSVTVGDEEDHDHRPRVEVDLSRFRDQDSPGRVLDESEVLEVEEVLEGRRVVEDVGVHLQQENFAGTRPGAKRGPLRSASAEVGRRRLDLPPRDRAYRSVPDATALSGDDEGQDSLQVEVLTDATSATASPRRPKRRRVQQRHSALLDRFDDDGKSPRDFYYIAPAMDLLSRLNKVTEESRTVLEAARKGDLVPRRAVGRDSEYEFGYTEDSEKRKQAEAIAAAKAAAYMAAQAAAPGDARRAEAEEAAAARKAATDVLAGGSWAEEGVAETETGKTGKAAGKIGKAGAVPAPGGKGAPDDAALVAAAIHENFVLNAVPEDVISPTAPVVAAPAATPPSKSKGAAPSGTTMKGFFKGPPIPGSRQAEGEAGAPRRTNLLWGEDNVETIRGKGLKPSWFFPQSGAGAGRVPTATTSKSDKTGKEQPYGTALRPPVPAGAFATSADKGRASKAGPRGTSVNPVSGTGSGTGTGSGGAGATGEAGSTGMMGSALSLDDIAEEGNELMVEEAIGAGDPDEPGEPGAEPPPGAGTTARTDRRLGAFASDTGGNRCRRPAVICSIFDVAQHKRTAGTRISWSWSCSTGDDRRSASAYRNSKCKCGPLRTANKRTTCCCPVGTSCKHKHYFRGEHVRGVPSVGGQPDGASNPYAQAKAQNPQAPLPIREEMIKQALSFLNHETVRKTASENQKRTFLLQKGLTEEEVTEALTRAAAGMGGSWAAASSSSTGAGGGSSSISGGAAGAAQGEGTMPKFVYPPPSYLQEGGDGESSILRTFLQVSGAVSIGALAYRWLQNNEAWIQERTGVSLGLAPTHDELNQGDDGAGGGSSHTALKLQQQAAEIGHLRSAVEELRETNLSLQDEIAKRNGELMQSLSQLMEKTTDLTTAANTNSNAGTASTSEGPSSVSAKLDPDDLEKIAEVVAAKLASQTQTTNSAAVSLRGSGESDAAGKYKGIVDLPEEEIDAWKARVHALLLQLVRECENKNDASKTLNMLYLVNTASTRFKERLGNKKATSELLLLLGFEKKGQNFAYELTKPELERIAEKNLLPVRETSCPVPVAVDVVSDALHGIDVLYTEATTGGATTKLEDEQEERQEEATMSSSKNGGTGAGNMMPGGVKIRNLLEEEEEALEAEDKATKEK
eukprot:g8848.t1